MSGSSGSSRITPGNGGSDEMLCENLEFTTILSSPQENEIQQLQENDVLSVDFQGGPVKVISPNTGNPVGSVNWSGIERLIECIEEGFSYVAQVLSIDGGQVRVRISPKRG